MEYIHTKTIKSKGATINIFSPVLTEEERTKRMKAIYNAAAVLLKETEKSKRGVQI